MDQYVSLFFVQVKFDNYSLLIGNRFSQQQQTKKGIGYSQYTCGFFFFQSGTLANWNTLFFFFFSFFSIFRISVQEIPLTNLNALVSLWSFKPSYVNGQEECKKKKQNKTKEGNLLLIQVGFAKILTWLIDLFVNYTTLTTKAVGKQLDPVTSKRNHIQW